ncbi:GntR family transcriptional regulator [Luteococcus sp.]|uniref:GntR family transcriptional regulator n=1 Tax=Luteococcus sp. TaxID=1969402 RepID=UPI003735C9E5
MANRLRAQIRTGELPQGAQLDSQHKMAERYGVARMTIQQALRVLREEGLIVTRQGSGAFVKGHTERAVDLRPRIQEAFTADEVTIDFCGFTAETLAGALTEPLDRIRSGALHPRSLAVRIMLPDTAEPLALPVLPGKSPAESGAARERLAGIASRSVNAVVDMVDELAALKLLKVAMVESRFIASAPQAKTFIINSQDVFQGYYPVKLREVRLADGPTEIYDPMGKDATLFHFAKDSDPESLGSLYVQSTTAWFDSLWTTIARAEP